MAPSKPSYLIVGAGVFGVSTAYHLIQKYPDASVTLVDRDAFDADSRVAASWDWNKVVRADYDDFVYCQLALEAQDIFKTNPLWKPYFHQTGVYWTCRSDYATNVIAHHHKLGRKDDIIALPVSEARKLYNGLFDDADYSGVKEVLVNRASGWAAAGDCLRAITRKALDLGVKYVTAETAWLQTDGRGSCTGIRTATGEVLTASHVILCTGAYTPKLLELSAAKIGLPNLRAGDRILAAGIATGMAQLDEKEYEKYVNMPVGFQGYTAQHGNSPSIFLPPPSLCTCHNELAIELTITNRQTLHWHSTAHERQRAEVVGIQDLLKYPRSAARLQCLCATSRKGLRSVEGTSAPQERRC